jgi:hypothetical protein
VVLAENDSSSVLDKDSSLVIGASSVERNAEYKSVVQHYGCTTEEGELKNVSWKDLCTIGQAVQYLDNALYLVRKNIEECEMLSRSKSGLNDAEKMLTGTAWVRFELSGLKIL